MYVGEQCERTRKKQLTTPLFKDPFIPSLCQSLWFLWNKFHGTRLPFPVEFMELGLIGVQSFWNYSILRTPFRTPPKYTFVEQSLKKIAALSHFVQRPLGRELSSSGIISLAEAGSTESGCLCGGCCGRHSPSGQALVAQTWLSGPLPHILVVQIEYL